MPEQKGCAHCGKDKAIRMMMDVGTPTEWWLCSGCWRDGVKVDRGSVDPKQARK